MSSFIFTGDICFTKNLSGKSGDKNLLSSKIKDFLASADHVVANTEGVMLNAFDLLCRGLIVHRAKKFHFFNSLSKQEIQT